ncbi:hydroxypyruvate isomerase family protein [Salinihabitans flavidus]|nr:TIM barrel protein [Salinihabitans flavidus]
MLFTEVALADRLAAARDAGFDGVEIQFPEAADIAPLRAAIAATGLPVVLINVPRGTGDEVGLAALPGRGDDFRAAVATCARQATALSADKVNILSGRPPPDADPALCRRTLIDNLRHAAGVMADIGVRVMVEPVNPHDVPGFFLTGLQDALDLLDEAEHDNLFVQFDFYHMAITEADLCAAIAQAGPRIGHVQFADAPGRNEPGTGDLDFPAALTALRKTGYDGALSAEYRPAGDTTAGLEWIDSFRKMIA